MNETERLAWELDRTAPEKRGLVEQVTEAILDSEAFNLAFPLVPDMGQKKVMIERIFQWYGIDTDLGREIFRQLAEEYKGREEE